MCIENNNIITHYTFWDTITLSKGDKNNIKPIIFIFDIKRTKNLSNSLTIYHIIMFTHETIFKLMIVKKEESFSAYHGGIEYTN